MIILADEYLLIHENGIWAVFYSEDTVHMLRGKKQRSPLL
jgi:hypothetical protein